MAKTKPAPKGKRMRKIKATKEGRKNVWLPDKDSLKEFIRSRKMKMIHNLSQSGMLLLGADHDVKSVLEDIDNADRLTIFTNPLTNMGHSLAIIRKNTLDCYDIGKISESDINHILPLLDNSGKTIMNNSG